MKYIYLIVASLAAVAVAYPTEEVRSKRSAVLGLGTPAVIQGAAAVLQGPSGIVSANTGHIGTSAAVVAAPAHGLWAGHGSTILTPANAHSAGNVISPAATLVGPTTSGHPGAVIAPIHHGLGLGVVQAPVIAGHGLGLGLGLNGLGLNGLGLGLGHGGVILG